jgi:hypothetical protein
MEGAVNRWTLGLLIAAATVLAANMVLVKLALDNAPQIEPSYQETQR